MRVWRPGEDAAVALWALLGLLIGSFLNVVIARAPAGRSVVGGSSACPACGSDLRARDLVPVVSWMMLRGRCRSCSAPISWRYPAVEAGTAALFAVAAWRLGSHADLAAHLVAFTGLLALSVIDVGHHRLPSSVLYPTLVGTAVGLLAATVVDGDADALVRAGIGGAAAFGFFFGVHAIRPDAMGFGDVRLAGLCGLVLGWSGLAEVVLGFYASFVLGAVVGVARIASGRAARREAMAFGPFLAVATFGMVCFGGPLAEACRNQF